MNQEKNFQSTLEKLGEFLRTFDLNKELFDEFAKYFDILDSKKSTYQEKYETCIIVEYLMDKAKDLPKISDRKKSSKR